MINLVPIIHRDALAGRHRTGVFLAGAVVIGVASALAGWQEPLGTLLAALCLVALVAGSAVVGIAGICLMAPAIFAFLLMNRIDEMLVIEVGNGLAIKVTLWLTTCFVGALSLHVFVLRGEVPRPATGVPAIDRFMPRFTRFLLLFLAVGASSIGLNHLLDTHITDRFLPGELLALFEIGLPIVFVLLIPRSNLSEGRVLLCLRGLVGLCGLGGLIMVLFGLLPDQMTGYLGWAAMDPGTLDLVRGRLPLGHPNKVAAVMLLFLPFTMVLMLGARRMFWRFYYAGCAALMVGGILFALSRSALLVMALVFIPIFAYLLLAKENRRFLGVLLTIAAGAFIVAATAYLFSNYDFSRFWSRGYFEDASSERRIDSMVTALYVWRDHPVYGVGPDALYPRLDLRPGWAPVFQDRISPFIYYEGRVTAETPHNFYLTVLAEVGLAGAVCFFGMLGYAGHCLWRARRLKPLDAYAKKVLTGLGFGVVAFLMMGVFDAMLMTGFRANILFWIYIGLAIRYVFLVTPRPEADG